MCAKKDVAKGRLEWRVGLGPRWISAAADDARPSLIHVPQREHRRIGSTATQQFNSCAHAILVDAHGPSMNEEDDYENGNSENTQPSPHSCRLTARNRFRRGGR